MRVMHAMWAVLPPARRREGATLLAGMVLGAVLEMAGIGLLFPLLALLTGPEASWTSPRFAAALAQLGFTSHAQLVAAATGAFVVISVVRLWFLAWLVWRQSRFIESLVIGLSTQLYAGYLNRPCTFHMQHNSAQLIRNTTGEVANVALGLQNTMGLLSESLVALGVATLLLAVDPWGMAAMACLLGGAGWCFNQFTRHRIVRWAEEGQHHEGLRLQQLQQGLGGIKAVKLLGVEDFVLKAYAPHNEGSAKASQRHTFLAALPRLWLELLVVIGLGAYVAAMVASHKPAGEMIPVLGVLGAAAFRLMPSVNRLLQALQGIRFAVPSLRVVAAELAQSPIPVTPRATRQGATFVDALVLERVSFTYPGASAPALHEVTLRVPRGVSVGFVGGSGAGKSTLLDVLLGLLPPTSGAVYIDGSDLTAAPEAWQAQIGYVPQTIYLTDDTLRRNIAFGLPDEAVDEVALGNAIRLAQLESVVSALPDGLETRLGEHGVRLSGGQRQRIGVARALYRDPAVLVLDEATSALDHETESELIHALEALQGSKTLLIVAHRLSTVARCDVIHRLEAGRVVGSGPPSAMLGLSQDPRPVNEAP